MSNNTKKTVISHFYNEEWLLPFWLKHHRQIFDHGIMIDYHSTDRSCEIIRELCPTWEIHTSANVNFQNVYAIDREVEKYEQRCEGWRTALNTTEFLIGNYSRLNSQPPSTRIYLGQYIIVDVEDANEPTLLDNSIPIYEQRHWGYGIVTNFAQQKLGSVARPPRSIHNYSVAYPVVGRHFWNEKHTYDDLVIFYYGYASIERASLDRRLQIQTQMPNTPRGNSPGAHHIYDEELLLRRFREEQKPLSHNLNNDVSHIIKYHEDYIKGSHQ